MDAIEMIEVKDVAGEVIMLVEPAEFKTVSEYLASVQAEFDRALGAGVIQVAREGPVNDDGNDDD